jgi:hypothetical protein
VTNLIFECLELPFVSPCVCPSWDDLEKVASVIMRGLVKKHISANPCVELKHAQICRWSDKTHDRRRQMEIHENANGATQLPVVH